MASSLTLTALAEGLNLRRGEFLLALTFLTRLPLRLPVRFLDPESGSPRRSLADSMWSFPVIGAVCGLVTGGIFLLGLLAGLPGLVAAGAGLLAGIALTGALHEDGLGDLADSYGAFTREKRLEIMRDSRVGTYGVLALVLSLLLRAGSLAVLPGELALVWLCALGGLSRLAPVLLLRFLPPAREGGLGAGSGRPGGLVLGLAGLSALLLLLPGLCLAGGFVLWLLPLAGLAVLFTGWQSRVRLGGQTGDVLGASVQIVEIPGLILAACLVSG